jgi:hypothetical protein
MAETYARAGLIQQTAIDPAFFCQVDASLQQVKLAPEEQARLAAHPEINFAFLLAVGLEEF